MLIFQDKINNIDAEVMQKSKLYFKGLNGLRFIAALLVVIYHASTFATAKSAPAVFDFRPYSLFNNGGQAVDFFFVLSGFLITSLLLKEYDKNNTISVKQFYIRRILRIWPLYYFIVFVCFAIFPLMIGILHIPGTDGPDISQLGYYIFFLANLGFIYNQSIFLSPLWSICVEEQFYLFVAPVIKYCRKYLVVILIGIILVKFCISVAAPYYLSTADGHYPAVFYTLRFEIISIGCLGALFLRSKYNVYLPKLFSYPVQVIMFGFLFVILFFNKTFATGNLSVAEAIYNFLFNMAWGNILIAILFMYVILCISLNPKSIVKTDNRLLDFLGDISYGMYMYHVIIELLVLHLLQGYFIAADIVSGTLVYYLLSIALTILVAYLSYALFEKRFLNVKKKFV